MSVDWDFGDGNTATAPIEEPVTHTYDVPGEHPVTADLGDEQQLTKPLPVTSPNLLPANAASFEDGTTGGWTPAGAGVSLATTDARAADGIYSLAVTQLSDDNNRAEGPWVQPFALMGRRITFMASAWSDETVGVRLSYWRRTQAGAVMPGLNIAVGMTVYARQWTVMRGEIVVDSTVAGVRPAFTLPYYGTRGTYYIDRVGIFLGSVPSSDWALPPETP